MSGSDTLPVQAPSDGIKGLAMMAPVVGLPLLLHALGGAVITGIGFTAVSSVMNPLAEKILHLTRGLSDETPCGGGHACQELPVAVTITVEGESPASKES